MRGTEHLIPEARCAARAFADECRRRGLPVLITDTLRTKEEQNALYAQGRSTPGQIVTSCRYPHSLHNWGCAFDFCKNVVGHEYDDPDFFQKCGQLAEDMGLVWGGKFKNPDRPHIQLREYAPDKTAEWLCSHYESPEYFIKIKKAEAKDDMTNDEFKDMLEHNLTPGLSREIVLSGMRALAFEPCDAAWESEAVAWAAERGIFRGDGTGSLMPKKPVTRAELAKALKNTFEEGRKNAEKDA
ncbi:MAG: S-layer homology domain-containing protein [Clostridia bacterium]|nr:S-layer homology domain-containing protein [Clostridia bacterium]